MKVSMILSVEKENNPMVIGRQAALICSSNHLVANIVPILSSIKSNNQNHYHVESGCKVELLSDLPRQRADDVLYLFKRFQEVLGIYCVWLDIDGPWQDVLKTSILDTLHDAYHGCILEWPYYVDNYSLIHEVPTACNPSDKPIEIELEQREAGLFIRSDKAKMDRLRTLQGQKTIRPNRSDNTRQD